MHEYVYTKSQTWYTTFATNNIANYFLRDKSTNSPWTWDWPSCYARWAEAESCDFVYLLFSISGSSSWGGVGTRFNITRASCARGWKCSWSFHCLAWLKVLDFVRRAVRRYKVCSCIHSSDFECLFSKQTVQASGWSFRKRPSLSSLVHTVLVWFVVLYVTTLYVCVWYVRGQCVCFTTSAREVLRYRSVNRACFVISL